MKSTRLARLAATGAATALAAATLVGGTGTTAHAETSGTATYNCPHPLLGDILVPITLSTDDFDAPLPAFADADGVRNVTAAAELPMGLVGALTGVLGITSIQATLEDFLLWVGEGGMTVSGLETADTPLPASGALPLEAVGNLGLVTPNQPGEYPVMLPETFTLVPNVTPANPLVSALSCTLVEGQERTIGTATIVKAGSTTKVRTQETKKGHRAVVTVTRAGNPYAGGTVTGKVGKKTIAVKKLKNGKAVFALPAKAHGKRFTAIYGGDQATEGSRGAAKVK